ncbi:MliC family protein [Carnimonas nigrificans]|uniref:MliC family protein n=1 Tax=Carnimonas nigrificans TaxID=64323 RepID=UPI0004B7BB7C|nr:MliC family protein [Carnimonas nigrificans]
MGIRTTWILMAVTLSLAGCGGGALPENAVELPGSGTVEKTTVHYQCSEDRTGDDAGEISVEYLHNDTTAIALVKLPNQDDKILMNNVISGSGERYTGGIHEWWAKGDDATLRNGMDDDATLNCSVPK